MATRLASLALVTFVLLTIAAWSDAAVGQADPVIEAAGDIACDPGNRFFHGRQSALCQMKATSDLMIRSNVT